MQRDLTLSGRAMDSGPFPVREIMCVAFTTIVFS